MKLVEPVATLQPNTLDIHLSGEPNIPSVWNRLYRISGRENKAKHPARFCRAYRNKVTFVSEITFMEDIENS
jgi:hypothetical protein